MTGKEKEEDKAQTYLGWMMNKLRVRVGKLLDEIDGI